MDKKNSCSGWSSLEKRYEERKLRARTRGIEFTLTLKQYKLLEQKNVCYYTGKPIYDRSDGGDENFTKTLDRLNPNIGYTKENTVMCAYSVNQLKNKLFENVQLGKPPIGFIILQAMIDAGVTEYDDYIKSLLKTKA